MLDDRSAAQLFTSQAINKIVSGDYSFLQQLVHEYVTPRFSPVKVSDVFELTYEKSIKEYKGEYYYKNIIANKLFLKNHYNSNATVVSEFRVGSNKADFVIVNGHSVCYEIKTERDTLKRLPEQIKTFSKVFDRVYVVCSNSHLSNVFEMTPDNIGIIELNQNGTLKEVKKALSNVEMDCDLIISSLRKNEYVYIAEKILGNPLHSSNMDIFSDCLSIFKNSSPNELKKLYREALKKYRKSDFDFLKTLPTSLINSAISFKMTQFNKKRLREKLAEYIY